MRWRGVHHVEFSVLDYEKSVAFYDKMFGWLGYTSFWTLDIGYRSTYYMARFPVPHSYIGIQPAQSGGKLNHDARATGIHHIALWAKNRREVNDFYNGFLRFSAPRRAERDRRPRRIPGLCARLLRGVFRRPDQWHPLGVDAYPAHPLARGIYAVFARVEGRVGKTPRMAGRRRKGRDAQTAR